MGKNSKKSSKKTRQYVQNQSAGIRSRVCRNSKFRTETFRRDSGLLIAATTNPKTNATSLFIDMPHGETLVLSGREARTVYRVLENHYVFTGKQLGA